MASQTTIKKFLLKAKKVSEHSTFHKQSIGCIFVLGNKIITEGFNSSKTYPIQKEYNTKYRFKKDSSNNGAIHAEMMCLNKTKFQKDIPWSDVEVYVYREYKKTGLPALAKPCIACINALTERGINPKNIYFTTNEIPYDIYEK